MGYAEDPDSLEASTLGAVWADETGQRHFKEDSHETIESRVMTTGGPILYTSRPYLDNWFVRLAKKADYRVTWQVPEPGAEPLVLHEGDAHAARVAVVNYSSLMNPTFEASEYWRKKEEMPAWKHRLKYDGVYTKPAGAIYDCFERETHTYDPKKVKLADEWPVYVGIDFGPQNTAAVFLKEDLEGRLYVYAYYRAGGEFAEQHVPRIRNKAPLGIDLAVGGSWSEGEWRQDYSLAGLEVLKPPIKEVEVGIQRVYRQFKKGGLLISSELVPLIEQIETYSRKLDDEGEPKEDIEAKETFHGCDALRYAIAELRQSADWVPVTTETMSGGHRLLGEKGPEVPKNPQEADKEVFERNSRILAQEAEREDEEEGLGARRLV
jgi:hypothetical protein